MTDASTRESGGGGGAWLRPARDVVSRRLEDQVVLVNLRTNLIYELNETGARFWELLEEGCDRSEVERRMVQEFDVREGTLRTEINGLVSSLSSAGLVEADGRT